TPLSCGNRPGTNCHEIRTFTGCFNADSFQKAIKRACKILYPAPKGLAKDERKIWEKQHSWHPHQIRHTAGTEIRKKFGLDATRAVLGHKKIATTEYYAQLDLEKAVDVAKAIG
ncbi:MAG TPA: tyrosine-type recombinase/integrase, partial [Patescibacteria group bacterium]|nr:tyrosine-type recombinase/integrase [Patescibacteria group bacterium]